MKLLSDGWTDIQIAVGGANGVFTPEVTRQVTIEVKAPDAGPWTYPTIVFIDSIRSLSGLIDHTFDADLGAMVQSTTQVVEGSTMTWVNTVPESAAGGAGGAGGAASAAAGAGSGGG